LLFAGANVVLGDGVGRGGAVSSGALLLGGACEVLGDGETITPIGRCAALTAGVGARGGGVARCGAAGPKPAAGGVRSMGGGAAGVEKLRRLPQTR